MSEISSFCRDKNHMCSILFRLYSVFNFSSYCYSLVKHQGESISRLLLCLLVLRLCHVSIFFGSQSGYWQLLQRGKDSFYQLLNRPSMNWRKLLYATSTSFLRI